VGPLRQAFTLAADPLVTEDGPQRRARQRQQAHRRRAVEARERVLAGRVRGGQDRLLVTGHRPGQAAVVDRAAAADGTAPEVHLGAEVARLDAAAPLYAQRP